jgi:hypothetical protein
MVRLAHNEDFFPEALDDFLALDQTNVQALDGKIDAGLSVGALSNNPGGARPEDRTVVDAVVDHFDLLCITGLKVESSFRRMEK